MPMAVEGALEILQGLVDRGGPELCDYPLAADSIETLHQTEFSVEEGSSLRNKPLSCIDDFFTRNAAVFGTPASMQGFVKCKPHGYAGDFEIIERIYHHILSGRPELRRWDEFFHYSHAAKAVRNRASVFQDLVDEVQPRHLLSVACGPALDVASALNGSNPVQNATLLDNDPNALRRAAVNLATVDIDLAFREGNALRYRPETPQDLIWCSGLFDYLSDRAAVMLLKRLFGALRPGGTLAVGNFAKGQPSRPYMEVMGHWLLIHRDMQDCRNLAKAAGMPPGAVEIRADATGVNLFLVARA